MPKGETVGNVVIDGKERSKVAEGERQQKEKQGATSVKEQRKQRQ